MRFSPYTAPYLVLSEVPQVVLFSRMVLGKLTKVLHGIVSNGCILCGELRSIV